VTAGADEEDARHGAMLDAPARVRAARWADEAFAPRMPGATGAAVERFAQNRHGPVTHASSFSR
jgi:hypothetical protein